MSDKKISLHERVAVVTGSTRGIGRVIAETFGRAGARLVISSSRPAAVERAVAEISAQGIVCIGVTCDVAQRAQVEALAAQAIAQWGRVDIWVNNAGISGPFGYTLDVPPERWEEVIRVNLLGSYYGSTVILPHMLERRYGRLINLSGGGAKRAQRFLSAYSTSKAAIVRMSEGLARDYREQRNITINVLEPGIVPTDMLNMHDAIGPGAAALKALPRVMRIFGTTAEEAADLALQIAAEQHRVSGKVFSVLPKRRQLWRLAQAAVGLR